MNPQEETIFEQNFGGKNKRNVFIITGEQAKQGQTHRSMCKTWGVVGKGWCRAPTATAAVIQPFSPFHWLERFSTPLLKHLMAFLTKYRDD